MDYYTCREVLFLPVGSRLVAEVARLGHADAVVARAADD